METRTLELIGLIAVYYAFFGFALGHISWQTYHNPRGSMFRILWPLSMFSNSIVGYRWGLASFLGKRAYTATMVVFWPVKLLVVIALWILIPTGSVVFVAMSFLFIWATVRDQRTPLPPQNMTRRT